MPIKMWMNVENQIDLPRLPNGKICRRIYSILSFQQDNVRIVFSIQINQQVHLYLTIHSYAFLPLLYSFTLLIRISDLNINKYIQRICHRFWYLFDFIYTYWVEITIKNAIQYRFSSKLFCLIQLGIFAYYCKSISTLLPSTFDHVV